MTDGKITSDELSDDIVKLLIELCQKVNSSMTTTDSSGAAKIANDALNEVSSGKTLIANATGLPSQSTNSFDVLAQNIISEKNVLASILTNGGIKSTSSEALYNLVNKVADLSANSVKSTKGTVKSINKKVILQLADIKVHPSIIIFNATYKTGTDANYDNYTELGVMTDIINIGYLKNASKTTTYDSNGAASESVKNSYNEASYITTSVTEITIDISGFPADTDVNYIVIDTTTSNIPSTADLTGNALVTDVASGKTFYSNDANTKLTGTAPIDLQLTQSTYIYREYMLSASMQSTIIQFKFDIDWTPKNIDAFLGNNNGGIILQIKDPNSNGDYVTINQAFQSKDTCDFPGTLITGVNYSNKLLTFVVQSTDYGKILPFYLTLYGAFTNNTYIQEAKDQLYRDGSGKVSTDSNNLITLSVVDLPFKSNQIIVNTHYNGRQSLSDTASSDIYGIISYDINSKMGCYYVNQNGISIPANIIVTNDGFIITFTMIEPTTIDFTWEAYNTSNI